MCLLASLHVCAFLHETCWENDNKDKAERIKRNVSLLRSCMMAMLYSDPPII